MTVPDAWPGATCAALGHELAGAYLLHLRQARRTGRDAPLADRTIHHYVNVLKLFARWGTRGRRYWAADPLAEYETPPYVETEIVPYSPAELTALLAACGGAGTFMGRRLRAMLLVGLDTGMRRGELRQLTVPMVDTQTGRVRFRRGASPRRDRS